MVCVCVGAHVCVYVCARTCVRLPYVCDPQIIPIPNYRLNDIIRPECSIGYEERYSTLRDGTPKHASTHTHTHTHTHRNTH